VKRKLTIALSGNPNAGKTTVFNAITGSRQHIANYPGVTVEKKFGTVRHRGREIEVVDLPGTYSLTAYSLEEIVAREFLVNEKPDLVVDIVDASNLDRNLYLAVQFMELGIPLIIALNMVDVAESRGIRVDAAELERLLGVPVVPMVARSKQGIEALLDKILETADNNPGWRPAVLSYGMDIDQGIARIEEIIEQSEVYDRKYPARWRALKCIEGDRQILDLLKKDPERGERIRSICAHTSKHIIDTLQDDPEGLVADHRYGYIAGITKKVVKRKIESRLNQSDKIDQVLTNRILGPVIMLVILYLIYLFTFTVSEGPVGWLEIAFARLKEAVAAILPEGPIQSLVVSGIIDGVGGVLGFVPLIMFMFFAIAIMEDSGYMARVAYMLDRILRWFGLHGNSVIALIVSGGISGGCAVPGCMATRTLRNPKERIATLLVVPFMNCGAKLPVYAVLIAAFFSGDKPRMMFLLTLLSWGFALFAAKAIRSTVLRGPKTPFVMELPPYRMPTLRGLVIHTWERTWQYIKKAGTVILGISILLWAMMSYPGLSEEKARQFQESRNAAMQDLLENPHIKGWIPEGEGIMELSGLYESFSRAAKEKDQRALARLRRSPLTALVEAAYFLETGHSTGRVPDPDLLRAAGSLVRFREEMRRLDALEQQAALQGSIAGRIGRKMEAVTGILGFDYRINVALIGGFAAKEVVISTLGTAYSLGEIGAAEGGSLSKRLREDPEWNPLVAFTFLVFIMLYVPCFVTVVSIRKESSWRWACFSIAFNLVAAYTVALLVYQVGRLLSLGTG